MIGEESIATTDKMDYSDIKRACKDRSEYSCEEFCRRMEALPEGCTIHKQRATSYRCTWEIVKYTGPQLDPITKIGEGHTLLEALRQAVKI